VYGKQLARIIACSEPSGLAQSRQSARLFIAFEVMTGNQYYLSNVVDIKEQELLELACSGYNS
jgi:hypothetical protein